MTVLFSLAQAFAIAGLTDGLELNGFIEQLAGWRTVDDPYQRRLSIMESRLQLDLFSTPDWGQIQVTADTVVDGVDADCRFDLRQMNIQISPLQQVDLKIGRQAVTWGTGDLVFINDLFPKDWISFFVGRDLEYLKYPCDALKVNAFFGRVNLTAVYTPKFDPDKYITGSRLSYWNPLTGRIVGRDMILRAEVPDEWFADDELSVRLAGRIKDYELAIYGYWGYWKSPGGFDPVIAKAIFPHLDVYGASIEGPLGRGIANIETGWYRSIEDPDGDNAMINNSEVRYLLGYRQELYKDMTAGIQYYVEQILDYDNYLQTAPSETARDKFRHLVTARLTWMLLDQNLTCSFFCYYSPSDQDAYLRPSISFKATDNMTFNIGANVFTGQYHNTFFGQFRYATNLYAGLKFSF